jgi:hypothetical protein
MKASRAEPTNLPQMKHLLLTLALCCGLLAAHAQPKVKVLPSEADAQALSKEVAGHFEAGKVGKAFGALAPHWPIAQEEVAEIEDKTIRYLPLLEERFGGVIGMEKVSESRIGDFALRETYVVRYRYSAIRLLFTYYRNKDGWILNSFKWDDSFSLLFDEVKE